MASKLHDRCIIHRSEKLKWEKIESGKIKRKLQESESFELKSKIRRNSESDMRKRESETEFSKSNNKMLRS